MIIFRSVLVGLVTFTLHISKEMFSDIRQFLFHQQSSLVRFVIMCFFSTSGFLISVSSLVNIHSTYKRTTYSWSSSNLWYSSCNFLYDFVLPVFWRNMIYSSGFFSILAKKWISFKTYQIDPKFDGDHEYLVYFDDSSTVEELCYFRFTSGKICIKLTSELCSG